MKYRRRKNKKAYLRTLEAFFAFFITFLFIVFIVLKGISAKPPKLPLDILPALEQRDDFRDCIYAGNTSCVEDLVSPFMPGNHNFKIAINSPAPFSGTKDIYTETVFIASNQTNDYKIVYLYYWLVSG